MKIDLTSGVYQITIAQQYRKFYVIRYRGQSYTFNRLPMVHPFAPGILQRLAQAVSTSLHHRFGISMVAYLDDWLLFAHTYQHLTFSSTCSTLALQSTSQSQ
jgi:hypothetical protein